MLIHEDEVEEIVANEPHKRILKVLISPTNAGSKRLSSGLSIIPPGGSSNKHSHDIEEEIFYIISGKGKIGLNEEEFDIRTGNAIYIRPKTVHQLLNCGDETMKVYWTQSPPPDKSKLYNVHKIKQD